MCILCESKQKTYLSTNQKNDYHTPALYPLLGPQGSRSVCLGTFSSAGPWSDSMGETTTARKTLGREGGQPEWMG